MALKEHVQVIGCGICAGNGAVSGTTPTRPAVQANGRAAPVQQWQSPPSAATTAVSKPQDVSPSPETIKMSSEFKVNIIS